MPTSPHHDIEIQCKFDNWVSSGTSCKFLVIATQAKLWEENRVWVILFRRFSFNEVCSNNLLIGRRKEMVCSIVVAPVKIERNANIGLF
ncbi:hypothetical protein NPIL_617161 [Nephila pilipes]|uniref:Uncharacterized protein n=1 Tax=Nephila pilipes TaxID=299642 RepID=A0A8X6P3G3_NEPPI|nr:hypothetical protein NPIL_617161 [Nephila pilipes]